MVVEPGLVGNPECRFSPNVAHMLLLTVSDVFIAPPTLKRCYSEDLNGNTDMNIYPTSKKHHKSESSLEEVPEDLISLSLDLLNHIQQHESNSDTSGYVSSPSSASSHSSGPSPGPDQMITVRPYLFLILGLRIFFLKILRSEEGKK